jgi:hypothetical protein
MREHPDTPPAKAPASGRLRWALAALLLVAAAVAFAAGPAQAKVKTARLLISVRGSQATTWRLQKSTVVQGCTLSLLTDGSQMIRFQTAHPERVLVSTASPGSPFYIVNGGPRPTFSHTIPLQATAVREMESTADQAVFSREGCVRTIKGTPQPNPACGQRSGTLGLQLAFSGSPSKLEKALAESDGELVPLRSSVNALRLNGVEPSFGGGDLLSSLSQCLLFDSVLSPEAKGDLIDARSTLLESRLFAARPITIHASAIAPVTGFPGVSGQTIVTYNVTIHRAP